jgi:hypothetical protein
LIRTKRRQRVVAGVGALALVAVAFGSGIASANLTGSTFESTDGNMVVNTPGNLDWINAPNRHVGTDVATGQGDNSFGNGTHESEVNVTVVAGSIPNSKADLGKFADASETLANGDVMLYLAWTRNNDSGSTNFDFELNKAPQPDLTTPGAKVLNRTAGDLLINYALQGGAQNPTLSRRVWNGTAWGPEIAFGPAVADGGFNQTTVISNQLGGGGNIAAARFGEAAINMTAAGIIPNQNDPNAPCASFGSVYVKSRSSQSFTSEIKDFIAPIGVSLNNCGTIIIKKVTDPSPDTTNTSFPFTLTGGTINKSFSLVNGGSNTTNDVKAGSGYVAAEATPAGWTLTSATCDDGSPVNNISVSVGETVTCIFTNQARATLHVTKVAERDGVDFNFTSNTLTPAAFTLQNGDTQDFPNLLPGTYDSAETVPTGWNLDSATCDNGDPVGAVVLGPGDDVTCTYTNVVERGAVLIHKDRKHAADGPGDHPQSGVTFTVTNGAFSATAVTDASGNACVDNVVVSSLDGAYNVHETVPAGYHGEADKSYTVLEGDCASAVPVTFHNTPLTDVSVNVNSQVTGGTSTTVNCDNGASGTTSTGTVPVATNADPQTIICTIVVDP